jgi:hypothetical protein
MAAILGRVVRTPTKAKPYKAVLEHEEGPNTEHPVSTVREGEKLIREQTPNPPKRDTWRPASFRGLSDDRDRFF